MDRNDLLNQNIGVQLWSENRQRWQKLKTIYYTAFVTNLLVNLDHGILPACTSELKAELDIGDIFLGFLGSLVFAGLMIGSIISGILFTRYSCKRIILYSFIFTMVGYVFFVFGGQSHILLGCGRFITGFFQVFMVVYFPVWVDHFGDKNKTIWLSYLQIGPPLGVFLGYSITAVFNTLSTSYDWIGWRWSFYLQTILLLPC